MTDKKNELLTNKDFSEDFHKLDEMETKKKKKKDNNNNFLEEWFEEYPNAENEIDENFL